MLLQQLSSGYALTLLPSCPSLAPFHNSYIKRSLSLIPNNASPWTYLRGILALSSQPLSLSSHNLPKWIKLNLLSPSLLNPATPLPAAVESGSSSSVCIFALEYLLDVLQEEAEAAGEAEGGGASQEQTTTTAPATTPAVGTEPAGTKTKAEQEQVERLISLLKREDPVRCQWWEVRRREVLRALS